MTANLDCLVLLRPDEQYYTHEQAKQLFRALIYTHLPNLQKFSETIKSTSKPQDSKPLENSLEALRNSVCIHFWNQVLIC